MVYFQVLTFREGIYIHYMYIYIYISNPIQMGLRFLTLKPQKIGRKTQLSQSRIGAGLPASEPGLWDFQHLAIEKSLEFFQLKTPPNCIS